MTVYAWNLAAYQTGDGGWCDPDAGNPFVCLGVANNESPMDWLRPMAIFGGLI